MQEIERYTRRARIQHWIIVVLSLLLAITGLFLFVDWFGAAAEGGGSRVVHRVAAVGFVAVPVIYFLLNHKSTLEWIKEALTWGKADLGWVKAAPTYYFGFDIVPMPPQERSNSGQKLWMVVVLAMGALLIVSGGIMWFGKDLVPEGVFQWTVFVHDCAFIIGGAMLIVHVILGTIHPRFSEALRSIIKGKVSAHYAKDHHGKWYDRISSEKKA